MIMIIMAMIMKMANVKIICNNDIHYIYRRTENETARLLMEVEFQE